MRFLIGVLTLACLATAGWGQSSNPQVIVVTSSNVVPLSSSQTYVSRPDSSAPAGDNTGSSVAPGMVGSQVTGSSIATSQLSGVAQCQERYEMMLPATDSKGQLIDKSNLNSNPLMQAIEPCLDDYQNGDCGDLCHAALAPLVANFSCCMPYVYDRTLTLLPVIYSTVLPNYDDLRGFVSDTCDLDIADGDDTCGDSDNTSAVTETPINPYNSTISCLARFDAMDSQPIDMPGRLSNPIIDSLVNTCWQDYQNDECNDACKLSLRPYISNYTCCFEQLYERSLPALPLNVSSVLPQYGDLSDWLASTCEFSWNSDDDCNEDAPGNWDNTAISSSTPAVAVASGAGSQVGSNVLTDDEQGDNNGNESQGNNIDNGNENN